MRGFLRKHEQKIYGAILIMLLVFPLIPLVSGQAVKGRDTALWLARIGEIKEGFTQGNLP